MSKRPTRLEIFARAAEQLRADFEELKSVPHSGVKGSDAENLLKRFLNDHLPERFRSVGGFIIDSQDQVTGHNDLIIYDALNCPLYRADENSAIIPSNNTAAVIEIKSSLDKRRLKEAAEKMAEAKSLAKSKPNPPNDVYGRPINFETLGIVFAYDTPLSMEKLSEHYAKEVERHGFPNHIDLIFVLDKYMLSLATSDPKEGSGWGSLIVYAIPPAEGVHIAIGTMDLGNKVLDVFLRFLIAHLQFFRHTIDQPGFNWNHSGDENKMRIQYLTTTTLETDPTKRKLMLAIYREEAKKLIMGGKKEND